MKIEPVESFILKGLAGRCQQTFDCPVAYGNAADRIKILEKLFGGKPVEYPYIFINIQRMAFNRESYASNRLARSGIYCLVEDDNRSAHRVRLLPSNYETEIIYVTNSINGTDQKSGLEFQRRWLFAMRNGSLKFNVRYGRLKIRIGVTLGDSVETPQLENKTEQETKYEFIGTAVVNGYVSEPMLGQSGIVQRVDYREVLGDTAVLIPFN